MQKVYFRFFIIFFLATSLMLDGYSQASEVLSIEKCYELARQNYPLIKQKELITKSKEYTIANAHAGYLPQLSIYGAATYQSDVTRLPGPAVLVEPLSKDQYRIYGEINQSIYDGNTIKRQSSIYETSAQIEDQKVEVELYKIKESINQIFFGALLMDEQLLQIDLLKKDLKSSLQKVEASIANGTAFKTNADILKAEYLKADQRTIETNANRNAYVEMLGIFINQQLGDNTSLQKPAGIVTTTEPVINRPEMTLFNYQSQLLGAQYQVTNTRTLPKLGFYMQGGYGRPGLNMLKNEFDTFYLGGFRFSWNLGGYYNTKREKELLEVNLQSVTAQKETFLFNTNLALRQQNHELTKLQELIKVDEQIIGLRSQIKVTAKAQLDNGVITANDFLRELNAEDQARQNLSLHQIQLLMNHYNYQTTSGN